MINEIHFGDCRVSLRGMAAAGIKVQTCVTSPPYFGLRDYGHEGQIGLEETPEAYIAGLVEVFRCVRDVLADDGTLFINIGDSYFGAGARRAAACDTSYKEPVNSPASDCLCGSLCGACRAAYRIGKSRSGGPLAPTPALSRCASSREHTESAPDHLPTLDSARPAGRTSNAIQDRQLVSQSQPGARLDARASTIDESSLPLRGECSPAQHQGVECQLCECSFADCAQEFSHTVECSFCTELSESECRIADKGVLGLAYPNSATESLKQKDLIGIPWLLAFALRADGWYLRQDIIWHKPNPMPESVTDRCTKAHEYVFLLSKGPRYFYDAEAVKEPAVGTNPHDVTGRTKQRGMADTFKRTVSKRAQAIPGQAVGAHREDRPDSTYDMYKRNRRSVWTIATRAYKGAHFAVFPPALVEPCILAGSRPGDTVLDPFMGSGTTAAVAIEHGRQFVGCELNTDYKPLQDERIDNAYAAGIL